MNEHLKIYTKTGDDGTTALFDGRRVGKDSERVTLYGEIDELNAVVGLAAAFLSDLDLLDRLFKTQKDLFALGARLANPGEKKQKTKSDFGATHVTRLEQEIDAMEARLTPMKNFILPGGSPAAAALHLARTVCRRAERRLVRFRAVEAVDEIYLIYLNRLSDYLFVCARLANHLAGREDVPW